MIDPIVAEKVLRFIYAVLAVSAAIGMTLIAIAWRAGGDVREIKLAIQQHGPKIDKLDDGYHALDKRVTRIEARQEPAATND